MFRLGTELPALRSVLGIMTLGFLFVVPIVLGFLTVAPVDDATLPFSIFAPWIPSILTVAIAAALGYEGLICIVMALPILLVFSSAGGIMGRHSSRRARRVVMPALAVLPLLVSPLELRTTPALRAIVTETSIEIAAPASIVWPLVVSVDSIQPSEVRLALFTVMGFPQPISAVLSRPGVGGVRQARFAGGLVFTERVTRWEEGRAIGFTIRPNTESIPATTLDPHVTIGGPYFDVLVGEYELHAIDATHTRLVLRSEHLVSTRFNRYAGWWANIVMRSIQGNILEVIQRRAEYAGGARPA